MKFSLLSRALLLVMSGLGSRLNWNGLYRSVIATLMLDILAGVLVHVDSRVISIGYHNYGQTSEACQFLSGDVVHLGGMS